MPLAGLHPALSPGLKFAGGERIEAFQFGVIVGSAIRRFSIAWESVAVSPS